MPAPRTRPLKPLKDRDTNPPTSSRKKAAGGRISAACEACKRRKTKCTGGPSPCQLCESLGTECIIDLSLDMRRRAALQRTLDESKTYQESLVRLLDCIREGDLTIIHTLVNLLKIGAQLPDISAAIQQHPQNGANASMSSIFTTPRTQYTSSSSYDVRYAFKDEELSWPESKNRSSKRGSMEVVGASADHSRYFAVLLQRLRGLSDGDGENMLRDLVDEDSLTKIFQHLSVENLQPSTGQITTTSNYSIQSNQVDPIRERNHWHPVLSVVSHNTLEVELPINSKLQDGNMSFWSRQLYNLDTTSATLLNGFSTSESFQTPPSPSRAATTRRRMSSLSSAAQAAASPFVEPNDLFDQYEYQSLIVAHENPRYRLRVPLHLVQPVLIADESIMSRVYTDFLQAAREMIANGAPVQDILGPNDDIVVDLLFRQRALDDKWDCCSWACEVYRSFSEYDQTVKLASAFLLTRLMKWLLNPTIDNYAKMPDMIKPTPSQRQIPHIGAIDLIPIPCIRDASIANLRDWLTALGEARWTVNWPCSADDAIERDLRTGSMKLTLDFMDHVAEYKNWTVGASFLTMFPEVAGRIGIHY